MINFIKIYASALDYLACQQPLYGFTALPTWFTNSHSYSNWEQYGFNFRLKLRIDFQFLACQFRLSVFVHHEPVFMDKSYFHWEKEIGFVFIWRKKLSITICNNIITQRWVTIWSKYEVISARYSRIFGESTDLNFSCQWSTSHIEVPDKKKTVTDGTHRALDWLSRIYPSNENEQAIQHMELFHYQKMN